MTEWAAVQRVSIVGGSGSGKSELGRWVGAKLNVPVIHMDKEFFLPDWRKPEPAIWKARVEVLASAPSWVMEGNYFDVMEPRFQRSEAFVFLDIPTPMRIARVIQRTLVGLGRVRPDTGQKERWSSSFIAHAYQYMRKRRSDFADLEARCRLKGKAWVRIRGAHDMWRFKRKLRRDLEDVGGL